MKSMRFQSLFHIFDNGCIGFDNDVFNDVEKSFDDILDTVVLFRGLKAILKIHDTEFGEDVSVRESLVVISHTTSILILKS